MRLMLLFVVLVGLVGLSAFPLSAFGQADGAAIRLWAIGDCVKVDPENATVFEAEIPGAMKQDYRRKNSVWTGRTVRLDSARNEAVAFQVVIEGQQLKNVRVELQDLAGADGATIGKRNIKLFRQWYVWQKKAGVTQPTIRTNMSVTLQRISTRDGWYPDALIPMGGKLGAGFSIPSADFSHPAGHAFKQTNQAVWVDVFTPPATAPGKYAGKLQVTATRNGKAVTAAIPVELAVWGVTLPNEDHMTWELMDYGGLLRLPRAMDYYRMAHRHRLTIGEKGLIPGVIGKGSRDAKFDWTAFDKKWAGLFDGSAFVEGPGKGKPVNHIILRFDHHWPGGYGKEGFDETYGRLMKDWADHFRQKGWTKTDLVVWSDTLDEPLGYRVNKQKAMQQVKDLKHFAKLVHSAGYERLYYRLDIGTGFRYCRYDIDGDGKVGKTDPQRSAEVVRALATSTDYWNIHGYCINSDPLQGELASSRARAAWFYNGYDPRVGHSAINGEGVGLRTWPWVVKVAGLTGCCDWHFLYNKQKRNLFRQASQDDFPGRASMIYQGEQVGLAGPVASMRLKAMRRGKQDYEYLWMLSQTKAGRAQANRVALAIVWQTLGRDAKSIELPPGSDKLRAKAAAATAAAQKRETREKCARCWSHNPADYHNARMEMLKLLTAGK